jgi:copper chaperone CopZ
MTCASCTERIQASLSHIEGVISARVNFATEQARVFYDPARTGACALVTAVRANGFDVRLERTQLPFRSIGSVIISRETWIDARINWRTRCVEIVWLASIPDTKPVQPSHSATLHLLVRLIHSSLGTR